jgi:predicted enzyme involved in methoxymalonyl-ACP biosynthesis
VLTSKAEEYRAKARECEERAEATGDPFLKKQLLEIALRWRQMAEHQVKRE